MHNNLMQPCNLDVEEHVLGACLFDPNAFGRIKDILTVDSFFIPAHQAIYQAIAALANQDKPTDLMTVMSWLADAGQLEEIGGTSKLSQLVDRCVDTVNLDRYAELLLDKQSRRLLINTAYEVSLLAQQTEQPIDKVLEVAEQQFLACTRSRGRFNSWSEFQRSQYQRLIAKVREIVLGVSDPGERAYNLRTLAKQVGCQTRELEQLYYKSLLAEENESFMDLETAFSKYRQGAEDWLINGLIPAGTTILCHAPGGVGKTLFASFLGYLLINGQPWGSFTCSQASRRVALIQTDEPFKSMMKKIFHYGFSPHQSLKVKTRWSIDHLEPLRQEIISDRLEFVIIDSLTSINRHSLISENDSEYARPILHLRDIAQETGCTFLILHHDNKQGDARGSGAIFNSVSEVWGLKKHPGAQHQDDPRRLLTIEKTRSRRPTQFLITADFETYAWVLEEEIAIDKESQPLSETIVQFLASQSPTRYQAIELEAFLNTSGGYLRRCLSRLSEDGIIQRERPENEKAYVYFVKTEPSKCQETLNCASKRGEDQLRISWMHSSQEGAESQLHVVTDPTTAKDQINEIFVGGGVSERVEDQVRSEPAQGEGLTPDPLPDLPPDYAERDDQLSLPKFTKGDRLIYLADDFDRYQGVKFTVVEQKTREGVHLYRGKTGVGNLTPWLPESDLIEDQHN